MNTLQEDSHLVAGAISFLVFGASATAQVATSTWRAPRLFLVGLSVLPAGVAIVIAAILGASLPWLLAGGIVVGIGAGVAFRAAVTSVLEFAPVNARGEVLVGRLLIASLGLSVPVVLLGVLLQFAPMAPSIIAFGELVAVLLVVSAVRRGAAGRSSTGDASGRLLRRRPLTGRDRCSRSKPPARSLPTCTRSRVPGP